jgi:hypothetical protein
MQQEIPCKKYTREPGVFSQRIAKMNLLRVGMSVTVNVKNQIAMENASSQRTTL